VGVAGGGVSGRCLAWLTCHRNLALPLPLHHQKQRLLQPRMHHFPPHCLPDPIRCRNLDVIAVDAPNDRQRGAVGHGGAQDLQRGHGRDPWVG
jgi:hypothetical protein